MAKVGGKKGRKDIKFAAMKAARAAKRAGLPDAKPPKKPKKEKVKKPSKKKAALNGEGSGPDATVKPTDKPKALTKSMAHAKWPALFKKHIGIIEAHIRSLDRVKQSLKSDMAKMEEKERLAWELGQKGNWRMICEMLDRARLVLVSAREAAKGILPIRALRDKKGLGVTGTNFEPLGPQLDKKAADLGFVEEREETNNASSDDGSISGDSSKSGSSDPDASGDEHMPGGSVTGGDDFVSLNVSSPAAQANGEHKEVGEDPIPSNPYFIIDTVPTPVNLTTISSNGGTTGKEGKETKSEKKKRLAAEREAKKIARKSIHIQRNREKKERQKAKTVMSASTHAATLNGEASQNTELNLSALQSTLQAQIAVGEAAQVELEKVKKRRRSSESGRVEKDERKKVKVDDTSTSSKKVTRRKIESTGDNDIEEKRPKGIEEQGGIDTLSHEMPSKESKKSKRRKADDEVEDGVEEHGKRKKKPKYEIAEV